MALRWRSHANLTPQAAVALLLTVVLISSTKPVAASPRRLLLSTSAPAAAAATREAEDLPRPYVVIWGQDSEAPSSEELDALLPDCIDKEFKHAIHGVAGHFTAAQLSQLQAAYGDKILNIEADGVVHIGSVNTGGWPHQRHLLQVPQLRTPAPAEYRQATTLWNLEELNKDGGPLDGFYEYDALGTGVNVYMVDTGIRATHDEFRSIDDPTSRRAHFGFSAFGEDVAGDCNGHGTHTAGTVGGLTYGVAKNVSLYAVQVMDCDGNAAFSDIVAGLDWIAGTYEPPALVSMSVAGSYSVAVDQAVDNLVNVQGVSVVVAAGNAYQSACTGSPSGNPAAITVAAVDSMLRRYEPGNWGPCVDLHAPGVEILSANNVSDHATAVKNGTSMATPHVTGTLALYLEDNPGASPNELRQKLNAAAVVGAIKDDPGDFASWNPANTQATVTISDTPNRLLYDNLFSQAYVEPSVEAIMPLTGIAAVDARSLAPRSILLQLADEPQGATIVEVQVPIAWDGEYVAEVTPLGFTFAPEDWNVTRELVFTPTTRSIGLYNILLNFSSVDPAFDGAIKSVRVDDYRNLTGDTPEDPRTIPALPFTDSADTSFFADSISCTLSRPKGAPSPDVIYSYTPPLAQHVVISTCGSTFDTNLILFTNASDAATFQCNDDDPTCAETFCSRLSVQLLALVTYYIAVDGYNGSEGAYMINMYVVPPATVAPVVAAMTPQAPVAGLAGAVATAVPVLPAVAAIPAVPISAAHP